MNNIKVDFHKSLGGVECINKVTKDETDKGELLAVIIELVKDPIGTLNLFTSKKINKKLKGFNPKKIWEIKVGPYRIFYQKTDNLILILGIIRKEKNHTEQRYIKLLKQRSI